MTAAGAGIVVLARRARALTLVVAATWIAASAGPATAAPRGQILVLESQIGERTAAGAKLMERLRGELEAQGLAARPATIARLAGARAPRPGVADAGLTLASIKQLVDVGYDAFISARFDAAVDALAKVRRMIQRNPVLLVSDTEHANLVIRAHVGLALSLAKLTRHAESVEVITDLIRMYRGQPISPADYGPKAEEFYRSIRKQALLAGRGALTISAGHPQAIIFVDGQFRGAGAASLTELLPGAYQVLIQVPNEVGRRYEVLVRAKVTSRLEVDWDADAALWLGDDWVGLQFSHEAERDKEPRLAGAFVRRWVGGDAVAVISRVPSQGQTAVRATLYRTDGRIVRRATAREPQFKALARFLADGTPAAGLEIERGGAIAASPSSPGRGRGSMSLVAIGWGLGAGGLVGLGLSAYVDRVDANPHATRGYVVSGVGILAGVVSTVLYLRSAPRDDGPRITVIPTSSSVIAGAGWAF